MQLHPDPVDISSPARELSKALTRYQAGESRKTIFRDLVRGSVQTFAERGATILDIGCGHGFDGDGDLQRSLAEQANRFIGIEPDTQIQPPAYWA